MSEMSSFFQEIEKKTNRMNSFSDKQGLVSSTIKTASEGFSETADLYKNGLISYDHALSRFAAIFNEAYGIIPALRLSVRMNTFNQDQFIQDYSQWPNKSISPSDSSLEWLWSDASESPEKACWVPAAPQEKDLLLQLFSALFIPAEYLKLAPPDTVCPFVYASDSHNPEIVIPCVINDDGLLSHQSPAGHHFTLTDKYGLKIFLCVQSEKRDFLHHPKQPDGYWLECIGSIEGYTTNLPRPISLYINNGEIYRIKYQAEPEDHSLFHSYPLWQNYFRYLDHQKSTFEKMIKGIFTSHTQG